ncbi:hypothetical protein DL98DRAFT_379012, partial [Cadophora sp. DSE1049]
SRPDKLTGGCLCGTIRYTITITPGMEWPPTRKNGSCQCTLCRKFTGSLIHQSCTFPNSSISPPFTSIASYTQFASSEKAVRGFCRICGSSLSFSYVGADKMEILLGTIDEEILKSKAGTGLCLSKDHIWCENAVKGVTDIMPGVLWTRE